MEMIYILKYFHYERITLTNMLSLWESVTSQRGTTRDSGSELQVSLYNPHF